MKKSVFRDRQKTLFAGIEKRFSFLEKMNNIHIRRYPLW